jgi:hypothetical protein
VGRIIRLCSGRSLARMPIPICWNCKHYRESVSCSAFPKGIPWEILSSEADHHDPFRGDHGIRFERKDAAVVRAAALNGVNKRKEKRKPA